MAQLLTAKQLRETLAVDARKLTAWLKAGLPAVGRGPARRFDPAAVAAWLVDSGHAEQDRATSGPSPGKTCTTRAEAAAALGVNLRTFAVWLTDPTFPGTAGSPGRADGHFPLDQIAAWRAARFDNAPGSGQDELTQLRAARLRTQVEREQLAHARELHKIVDAEDVASLLASTIATAKSVLDQLPERIESNLPAKLPRETKARIRHIAQRQIEDAYTVLEQLSRGDEDDTEPEAA